MELTKEEVNILKDWVSECDDEYTTLYSRLTYNEPKVLRLKLFEKDLISYMLDRNDLSDIEVSIKNKLFNKNGFYR